MNQYLREFLAQMRAENAQMKAKEEANRIHRAARDAQIRAEFEQQKAAFKDKLAQDNVAIETITQSGIYCPLCRTPCMKHT